MSAAALLAIKKSKRCSRCSLWVRKWLLRRETEGCCAKLLNELRFETPNLYKNFVRMSSEDLNYLANFLTISFL